MAKTIPYDIWIEKGDSRELLLTFFSDTQGLDNATATTEAIAVLQDVIDKLTTPAPDTISANQGIIGPPQYHIRRFRSQEELEG